MKMVTWSSSGILMVILWAVKVLSIVILRSQVRLMTRHIEQEIDREFLKEDFRRLGITAKSLDISSCRLVFGEADFLPGLVVDKFF